MTGKPSDPPASKHEDRKKHRINSEVWASWAQVTGTVIAAIAVIVAIVVMLQGQVAIRSSAQTAARQSEDSQLSTAITALGSGNMAGRTTGLVLLGENTHDRVVHASDSGETAYAVYHDYQSSLQILSSYLITHSESVLADTSTGQGKARFGRGYGIPPPPGIPIDIIYAADQIKFLLNKGMERRVLFLKVGRPVIDLSGGELVGQPWYDVNFGWVSAYMPGIDLRAANLENSQWSKYSSLPHSYLQCANLQGAVFRGANLTFADLRGANVQGADFRGAKIAGIKITDLYGVAKWSPRPRHLTALPASEWNQSTCLRNHGIWDKPTAQ